MKNGRDWSFWPMHSLSCQHYIVKHHRSGYPHPVHDVDDALDQYRIPKTKIFHIKAWGNRGYK